MGKTLLWLILCWVAFETGGPIGTAAMVGLWVVVAYLPQRRRQAREAARTFHESDASHPFKFTSTTVDFEEMTLTRKVSRAGEEDEEDSWTLSRKGEGAWLQCEAGEWTPLGAHFATRLEVAYQRYLRTL
jgi:hypothetical protein